MCIRDRDYVDTQVAGIVSTAGEIINITNASSKLVANTTELTNGTTPINMNSQKITNLANAVSNTDALNRQTADGRYYSNTTRLD